MQKHDLWKFTVLKCHYWETVPGWPVSSQFNHQSSPVKFDEFPLQSTWLTYMQTWDWSLFTQWAAAACGSSLNRDSVPHFLLLMCRALTLCFYPSCRSHPLCGTLWLRGADRRRPQLQERRKVPDYQQHVSRHSCLSDCLHSGGMRVSHFITVFKKGGVELLRGEQTGQGVAFQLR